MNERKRGFLLVFCTAFISGFSIFINRFAIAQFDPFVFTALKNSIVGIFVISFIYLSSRGRELIRMPKIEWAKLAVWGAVDGGVAFMLYFYGLKLTSSANASLLHKSMFLFASALAFIFLKERMNGKQVIASIILLIGAALLSGIQASSIGIGETMMLGAVLLWSAGNVACKKLLESISPTNVVFGRMLFGSLLMLGFLATTGDMLDILSFAPNHYIWLLLTAALLLGYQLTYFNGLALLKVSEATSMLVLGAVITSLLSLFVTSLPTPAELLGMVAVIAGLALVYLAPGEVEHVHRKTFQSF
jgi:drug/metabolite transporter (DMT)-like permease